MYLIIYWNKFHNFKVLPFLFCPGLASPLQRNISGISGPSALGQLSGNKSLIRSPLPPGLSRDRQGTRQGALSAVYDYTIGSQEMIVERAKQVMMRVKGNFLTVVDKNKEIDRNCYRLVEICSGTWILLLVEKYVMIYDFHRIVLDIFDKFCSPN